MKTKKNSIATIFMLSAFILNAQDVKTLITDETSFKDGAVANYFFDIQETQKKNENHIFNDKMLNILFASDVASYVNDSKDLSLQKAYAVISTANNTLFLGTSFDFRKNKKTEKLSHLLTVGLKAKVKDDFTKLFKNGNIQNEIGFNFKYTLIGNGIIDYGGHKEKIINYRANFLKPKYEMKAAKYINDDFRGEMNLKAVFKTVDDTQYLQEKADDLYEAMAEEEIAVIRKEKLYNHLWNHWFTFEAFVPVTEKKYTLLPTAIATATESKVMFPWKINGGYTMYIKKSQGKLFYISGFASVYNNNNAEIEKLEQFELQTPNTVNANLIEKTTKVFLGDFEQFVTTNVKAEMVAYLFNKGAFGISGAVEQNFGDYAALNWKLGIPFSLKDKDDKPTVNFEFQWKEVGGNHFVGIGVGYSFGNFIK